MTKVKKSKGRPKGDKSIMPKLIRSEIISKQEEVHYEVEINGKKVYVSKYSYMDENNCEGDTGIFKGEENLTEDEYEEVLEFIDNLDCYSSTAKGC